MISHGSFHAAGVPPANRALAALKVSGRTETPIAHTGEFAGAFAAQVSADDAPAQTCPAPCTAECSCSPHTSAPQPTPELAAEPASEKIPANDADAATTAALESDVVEAEVLGAPTAREPASAVTDDDDAPRRDRDRLARDEEAIALGQIQLPVSLGNPAPVGEWVATAPLAPAVSALPHASGEEDAPVSAAAVVSVTQTGREQKWLEAATAPQAAPLAANLPGTVARRIPTGPGEALPTAELDAEPLHECPRDSVVSGNGSALVTNSPAQPGRSTAADPSSVAVLALRPQVAEIPPVTASASAHRKGTERGGVPIEERFSPQTASRPARGRELPLLPSASAASAFAIVSGGAEPVAAAFAPGQAIAGVVASEREAPRVELPHASLPFLEPGESGAMGSSAARLEVGVLDASLGHVRIQADMGSTGDVRIHIAGQQERSRAVLEQIAPLLDVALAQRPHADGTTATLRIGSGGPETEGPGTGESGAGRPGAGGPGEGSNPMRYHDAPSQRSHASGYAASAGSSATEDRTPPRSLSHSRTQSDVRTRLAAVSATGRGAPQPGGLYGIPHGLSRTDVSGGFSVRI